MKLPGTRKTLLRGLAVGALMASGAAVGKAPPAPLVPLPEANGPQADFPVVVGQPYQIGNVTFVPSDSMNFDSVGYASVGTEGGSTISAAHHTLPVPSYAEVTDINTGRTILVRVERRGPMDSAHAIELSPGAAAQLGVSAGSNTPVRVRRVNPAEAERAMLRSGNPAPERMATPKPLLNVLQRKLNPALAQRALDNADKDAGPNMAPEATPKLTPAATQPKPLQSLRRLLKRPGRPQGLYPLGSGPRRQTGGGQGAKEKTHPPKKAPIAKTVDSPAPVKAPEAPSATGSFTVQAGAFSDKARAQAVADKIGGALSPAGKMWRVRVGPYATHGSAEAALAKVKSAGYSGARIQRAE
jgi:rare lipoprotein A